MGVGFKRKLFILTVYVLCTIYLNLNIYPNNTDEPYVAVIISISPILISSLFKYESVPYNETMNILEYLYIILS